MMGHRQVEQAALFYEFSLEKHIPSDHLLRSIDRFVDLQEIRQDLAPFYSSIGRPSIDPELMIRMLLIGYCLGIRSERRLCDEVHLNLAYRWFCRLGLEGAVPDHSTFSKNRHGRFRQSDLFRRVFESVLRRCIEERLVGGEGFAVDASLIKADANRQKGIEGDKGLPPDAAGRAIDEYLAVLDDAAFGAATEVTPKFVSPSDPAARWTGAHGGQAFFAYSTNYLIDIENVIIVDVEATTAIRQAEVLAAKRMIERSLERFDLYPSRLLGDSGYGSAKMLAWLVYEHGIEPHVTVFDKSARTDGIFSRDDFTYDHAGDVYRCPGGKVLTTTGTLVNDGATMLYLASKRDCDRCALKALLAISPRRARAPLIASTLLTSATLFLKALLRLLGGNFGSLSARSPILSALFASHFGFGFARKRVGWRAASQSKLTNALLGLWSLRFLRARTRQSLSPWAPLHSLRIAAVHHGLSNRADPAVGRRIALSQQRRGDEASTQMVPRANIC